MYTSYNLNSRLKLIKISFFSPKFKIAWYHDGILLTLDTIRIYDDERYTIENPKSNEWKLVINSIDLNDEGLYSCRLSNGLKKIIHLKVGGMLMIISFF